VRFGPGGLVGVLTDIGTDIGLTSPRRVLPGYDLASPLLDCRLCSVPVLHPGVPESILSLRSPEDRTGTVSISPRASCITLEVGDVGEIDGARMNGLFGD
jgi:hypothetical protein